MLREIGLGAILLIILTAAVAIGALSQTTEFGPLAGHVGVNDQTALSWGQVLEPEAPHSAESTPEATAEAMVEPTEEAADEAMEEPTTEVTEESEDATPEAEATEEA